MGERLAVIGAGGFGRELLDVIDAVSAAGGPSFDIVVLDDRPSAENLARLKARRIRFGGGVDEYLASDRGGRYVIGSGAPPVRRSVAEKLDAAGLRAVSPLIHPTASTGYAVTFGPGTVVCAGVRLTTNIAVGVHVHLNLNSTVGHDTVLDDYVSVNPLASISGDCVIESGVLIGVAGVVLNGITVGKGSTVGGSACVVKDVPPGVIVKGIPAR